MVLTGALSPPNRAGFSAEADGLLTVTSTMSYSSLRHPQQARALLTTLATETSLFDRHCSPPERYLFVLVCVWGGGFSSRLGGEKLTKWLMLPPPLP